MGLPVLIASMLAMGGVPAPTVVAFSSPPTWTALSVPARESHSVLYDPRRGRMVMFGGVTRDGVMGDLAWFALQPGESWRVVRQGPSRPERRAGASLVLDPVRDEVYLFGGFFDSPLRCLAFSDLWRRPLIDGSEWSAVSVIGPSPAGRRHHVSIYDPLRDRFLVFGGTDVTYSQYAGCHSGAGFTDLWEFVADRDTAWRELDQLGEVPGAGLRGSAMLDSASDRMLFISEGSTWELSLSPPCRWRRVPTAGTAPSGPGPSVFDAQSRHIVAQRGVDTWTTSSEDTLRWRRITTSAAAPAFEGDYSAIWDSAHQALVIFGGSMGSCPVAAVWSLSLTDPLPAWTRLDDALAPAGLPTAIHDPFRDRVLAIGGLQLSQVLEFPLGGPGPWKALAVAGGDPGPRVLPGMVHDPDTDRIVMFGGGLGRVGDPYDRTWGLQLDTTPPTWTILDPSAIPEPLRDGAAAVYDPLRKRVLAFGGIGRGYSNETWEFRPATGWSKVWAGDSPPAPRAYPTAALDPIGDRLIIMGGWNSATLPDLWALSLSEPVRWKMEPAFFAGSYLLSSLIYDPVRERAVVYDAASRNGYHFWPGDPPGWYPLSDPRFDLVPSSDAGIQMVYDPLRDALIVLAPSSCVPACHDVWTLAWGTPLRTMTIVILPRDDSNLIHVGRADTVSVVVLGAPETDVRTLVTASLRLGNAAIAAEPSSPGVRFLDFDGNGTEDLEAAFPVDAVGLDRRDTRVWLRGRTSDGFVVRGSDRVRVLGAREGPPPPPPPPPRAEGIDFGIAGWLRGGGDSGVLVVANLPSARPARAELFDLAGRKIATSTISPPSPGKYEISLAGHSLSPGIYLVRLAQDRDVAVRKIALLP